MKCVRTHGNPEAPIPPYQQESLLIDAIPEMRGDRLLCTSAGLAQFAAAAARALPNTTVSCNYLDLYRANLATNYWPDSPPNLRIECAADLSDEEADIVALPFSARGEAELTRNVIQTGHQRLCIGGRMYASTDNRNDTWLRDQMTRVFRRLDRRPSAAGVLYEGTKTEPLKKEKNLACAFAFRDRGRLIRAYSRPGVFSHRHVDVGARRLIDEMQIDSGMRVLDIGCGTGVVALAAALRAADVTVHAVDSNARAIQCTQRGATLNATSEPSPSGRGQVARHSLRQGEGNSEPSPLGRGQGEGALNTGALDLTTELNATGNYAGAGTYDLALANPPYYSGFRIAQHFLTAARNALRPGGKIHVVTKHPNWYQQNMPQWYDDVTFGERKDYYLVKGERPASDG